VHHLKKLHVGWPRAVYEKGWNYERKNCGRTAVSSSDERIKQILERKQQEAIAAAAAARTKANAIEKNKAEQEKIAQLHEKWTKDTYLIAAAIKSLQEKPSSENVQFSFQAEAGNPGSTVGIGKFNGRGSKRSGTMAFNVFETGLVSVYIDQNPASRSFRLMDADQETYADVLLDFAEELI
jgi:hypothetical protein